MNRTVLRSIHLRLALASLVSVSALLSVCALAVSSNNRLSTLAQSAVQHNLELLNNASAVEALVAQRGLAATFLLTGDRAWLAELNRRRGDFNAWLARARDNEQSTEGRSLLASLGSVYETFDQARDQALRRAGNGDRDGAVAALTDSHRHSLGLFELWQEYDQRTRRSGEREIDRAGRALRDTTVALVSVSLIGAAASLLVGFLLARRLARPLYAIQVQVESAARRVSLPPAAGDELAALGDQVAALLRRMEETDAAIQEQRQRLIQSEKLSAIGEITAKLAHEVLNPLAGMKAAVQLLLRGPVHDANEVSETARALNHEIDRVELLLRRLIDYARPLSPRREHCPAERIISNASEAAAPALRAAGATLVVDLQGPLPELEVDPLLLTQALTNLLVNAAQASPPGGKVLLRAASLVRPERTQLSITVLDEGAGIAAEVKGRLFLPFFTTKPHGNGLGLAITQHILMEHEGQVRGDNRDDGRGAAFTLTLPVTPSGKEPQAAAVAHAPAVAHRAHLDQQQAGGSGVRASLDRR